MSSPASPNPLDRAVQAEAPARRRVPAWPRRLAWSAVAAIVLAGSSWLAVREWFWPNLDRWRPRIEGWLADAAGRPVRLGPLVTDFDGPRPRLRVRGIAVDDDDGAPAFEAAEVRAVLSLRALLAGNLSLALLEIDSPRLRVERVDARRVRVAGFEVDLDEPMRDDLLDRLFAHRRVALRGAAIDWRDRVTGEAAVVRGVDVAVGTVGRRHRASIRVPELLDAAAGVEAAVEFHRPPFAPTADWRRWRGEAYVGANTIDFAALAGVTLTAFTVGGVTVDGGQARLRAWSRFGDGALDDALVKLSALGIDAHAQGRRVPLRALDAEVRAERRDDGGLALAFERLRAEDDDGQSLAALDGQSALVLSRAGEARSARLALGALDGARIHELLARLPLPQELRRPLAALRVSGTIERLALDWDAARAGDPAIGDPLAGVGVDVAFERLGFQPVEAPPRPGELALPGFSNVSGSARIDGRGGRVSLRGESAVLRFPGLFAEPDVPLARLALEAEWTVAPPAATDAAAPASSPEQAAPAAPVVEVEVRSLQFANADASGELAGRYRSGGKGAGIVDLAGRLDRADAARTARYLPLRIPEDVRHWVRDAVRAGRSDELVFVLRGDLADFPFRDPASGEFRIEAKLADATLAYAPDWPTIERIAGRLRFERAGMEIDVASGRIRSVALGRTTARLADFDRPLLRIEGAGQGPAQDMVGFVNDSPLPTRLDDFTRDLSIGGDARLELAFEMPLDNVEATRVRGSVRFAGNDVEIDRTVPPLQDVSGRLEFTESRLALRGMRATLLGGPLAVEGDTPEPGRFVIDAQGTVPAEGIARLQDNALTRALGGAAAWRAGIDVRGRAASLVATSDLEGLSIALPAPFAKAAGEKWPLRVELRPREPLRPGERPAGDRITAQLRDDVRLAFERERDPDTQRLATRRGAFALAAEPVVPESGFAVLLRAPQVDLDAWNAVLGAGLAVAGASGAAGAVGAAGAADAARAGDGFSVMPQTVALVATEVVAAGKTLHEVVFGASRAGAAWRANVHAREIDGFFAWTQADGRQPQGTLSARFTRLEIPRDRIGEFENLLDSAPRTLPGLDVVADELVVNDRRLGALELKATNAGTPAAPVWQLQQLRVRHPAATLVARGSWQTRPGAARRATEMDLDLELRDAGALLATFGFPETVRGGDGRMSGKVRWVGSPLRLDYRSLDGDLAIELGKGQFLRSDPGIAKLIGVLNLQSLRRRLAFDFRDLFAGGFAFDRIDGTARIESGVVRTDDFRMRGLSADVRIRGQADIAAETQALRVEVRPELNAGLASLAYAALANPALGLGALVAQMALQQPLQQLFSFHYDVTGSWSDPQVVAREREGPAAPGPAPR